MKRSGVHLHTIVACLLTVAAVAAAPGDYRPQFLVWGSLAGQGTLTGTVTDKLTGAPIAGALVTINPGGLTAVTNAAGVYKATVRAGARSLTVSVPNRPPQSAAGVVVRNTGTTTVNFALLLPSGTGILAGYVRNAATNAPIANAIVSVSPSGKSTATDANGRYELWLPKGTYTVSASEACSVAASTAGVAVSIQTITTRDLQLSPLERGEFEVLHVFASTADGENPGTLIRATDGNFYGTAVRNGNLSQGAIFTMTPAGIFTPLHQFAGGDDGASPSTPLIQATDGDFYGTTSAGGPADSGTVFKVTAAGDVTVLHSFDGDTDGIFPSELIQGTDGDFYGTTSSDGPSGNGTVFRMTPAGIVTVLHEFSRGADGAVPYGGLVQATDGNFYGTTASGGESDKGTVFTMTPSGIVTVLHSFGGGADGAYPYMGLIQASDGDFYGTTWWGGRSDSGVVFKMTPAGDVAVLHSFTYQEFPNRLIQATDGNFYGTTFGDYIYAGGSIFRMTPAGAFTTLHSFGWIGSIDGSGPSGGLVEGTDGNFYGTTSYGGIPHQIGRGIVFRFRPTGCQTPAQPEAGVVRDNAKHAPFASRSVRRYPSLR